MAKHAAIEFNRLLDELFLKRTHWIRTAVRSSPQGRPPVLNRRGITKAIERLQDLASECLAEDYAWSEFDRLVEEKRQWHVTTSKGWGRDAKKKSFNLWFDRTIRFQNCIYIFWSNSTCLYVGRTMRGKGRPQSHFNTHWLSKTTRIDIYSTSSGNEVPKLECLAIHRFDPVYNKRRASKKMWAKTCPVCDVHEMIDDELRGIFYLK